MNQTQRNMEEPLGHTGRSKDDPFFFFPLYILHFWHCNSFLLLERPLQPPLSEMLSKNIWVAAGDGDLARVQILLESDASLTPNIPDDNTYTPMHAAASYGHLDVLHYLISRGGDVNVQDDDGDTPLYTVEDVATAEWLVNHGATVNHRNKSGVTASPIGFKSTLLLLFLLMME